jgi:hypothetical protein
MVVIIVYNYLLSVVSLHFSFNMHMVQYTEDQKQSNWCLAIQFSM